MYNIIKKFGIIVLVFCMLFMFNSCGKPKAKQSSKAKVQQVAKSNVNQTTQVVSESKIVHIRRTSPSELQPGLFGRENPFIPLVSTKSSSEMQRSPVNEPMPANKAIQPRSNLPIPARQEKNLLRPRSSLKLTLIIDGNSAVFEENNVSKSVSIGDTVAGMKVLEIRRSEVVLGKGDKKYTVMMGPLDIPQEE